MESQPVPINPSVYYYPSDFPLGAAIGLNSSGYYQWLPSIFGSLIGVSMGEKRLAGVGAVVPLLLAPGCNTIEEGDALMVTLGETGVFNFPPNGSIAPVPAGHWYGIADTNGFTARGTPNQKNWPTIAIAVERSIEPADDIPRLVRALFLGLGPYSGDNPIGGG